jgi:hypothetical protein
MKTKSLYGFSGELAPFVGKTAAEQVALLRDWGSTAIFGGDEDPEFVEAAHTAGLPVYAEFGCFVGEKWWAEVPESRPLIQDGHPLTPEEWYHGVNPTVPSIRQRLLERLERLLLDHAIDGVWLDFIRWPCHWESPQPYLPRTSFDAGTLTRFSHDTGIDVPTHDPVAAAKALLGTDRAQWTEWRCDQITSWVASAKEIVQGTRPGALLGLFGVPWRRSDYDGAILDIIGQDYTALGQYVDVFSPMSYHVMCGQPVAWIGDVAAEIRALSNKAVWPIVQSVDAPTPLSAEEYGQALDVPLHSPAADGVLAFTLKGALDSAKLVITQTKFRSA